MEGAGAGGHDTRMPFHHLNHDEGGGNLRDSSGGRATSGSGGISSNPLGPLPGQQPHTMGASSASSSHHQHAFSNAGGWPPHGMDHTPGGDPLQIARGARGIVGAFPGAEQGQQPSSLQHGGLRDQRAPPPNAGMSNFKQQHAAYGHGGRGSPGGAPMPFAASMRQSGGGPSSSPSEGHPSGNARPPGDQHAMAMGANFRYGGQQAEAGGHQQHHLMGVAGMDAGGGGGVLGPSMPVRGGMGHVPSSSMGAGTGGFKNNDFTMMMNFGDQQQHHHHTNVAAASAAGGGAPPPAAGRFSSSQQQQQPTLKPSSSGFHSGIPEEFSGDTMIPHGLDMRSSAHGGSQRDLAGRNVLPRSHGAPQLMTAPPSGGGAAGFHHSAASRAGSVGGDTGASGNSMGGGFGQHHQHAHHHPHHHLPEDPIAAPQSDQYITGGGMGGIPPGGNNFQGGAPPPNATQAMMMPPSGGGRHAVGGGGRRDRGADRGGDGGGAERDRRRLCIVPKVPESLVEPNDDASEGFLWILRGECYSRVLERMIDLPVIETVTMAPGGDSAVVHCGDEVSRNRLICLSPFVIDGFEIQFEVPPEQLNLMPDILSKKGKLLQRVELPMFSGESLVWPGSKHVSTVKDELLRTHLCVFGRFKPPQWNAADVLQFLNGYFEVLADQQQPHFRPPIFASAWAYEGRSFLTLACKDEESRQRLLLLKVAYLESSMAAINSRVGGKAWMQFEAFHDYRRDGGSGGGVPAFPPERDTPFSGGLAGVPTTDIPPGGGASSSFRSSPSTDCPRIEPPPAWLSHSSADFVSEGSSVAAAPLQSPGNVPGMGPMSSGAAASGRSAPPWRAMSAASVGLGAYGNNNSAGGEGAGGGFGGGGGGEMTSGGAPGGGGGGRGRGADFRSASPRRFQRADHRSPPYRHHRSSDHARLPPSSRSRSPRRARRFRRNSRSHSPVSRSASLKRGGHREGWRRDGRRRERSGSPVGRSRSHHFRRESAKEAAGGGWQHHSGSNAAAANADRQQSNEDATLVDDSGGTAVEMAKASRILDRLWGVPINDDTEWPLGVHPNCSHPLASLFKQYFACTVACPAELRRALSQQLRWTCYTRAVELVSETPIMAYLSVERDPSAVGSDYPAAATAASNHPAINQPTHPSSSLTIVCVDQASRQRLLEVGTIRLLEKSWKSDGGPVVAEIAPWSSSGHQPFAPTTRFKRLSADLPLSQQLTWNDHVDSIRRPIDLTDADARVARLSLTIQNKPLSWDEKRLTAFLSRFTSKLKRKCGLAAGFNFCDVRTAVGCSKAVACFRDSMAHLQMRFAKIVYLPVQDALQNAESDMRAWLEFVEFSPAHLAEIAEHEELVAAVPPPLDKEASELLATLENMIAKIGSHQREAIVKCNGSRHATAVAMMQAAVALTQKASVTGSMASDPNTATALAKLTAALQQLIVTSASEPAELLSAAPPTTASGPSKLSASPARAAAPATDLSPTEGTLPTDASLPPSQIDAVPPTDVEAVNRSGEAAETSAVPQESPFRENGDRSLSVTATSPAFPVPPSYDPAEKDKPQPPELFSATEGRPEEGGTNDPAMLSANVVGESEALPSSGSLENNSSEVSQERFEGVEAGGVEGTASLLSWLRGISQNAGQGDA